MSISLHVDIFNTALHHTNNEREQSMDRHFTRQPANSGRDSRSRLQRIQRRHSNLLPSIRPRSLRARNFQLILLNSFTDIISDLHIHIYIKFHLIPRQRFRLVNRRQDRDRCRDPTDRHRIRADWCFLLVSKERHAEG